MGKKVVKIKPIKVFTRTIFCGEELNFQLRFNLLPSTTLQRERGEDLDPSQQIGLRWEDRRKMGQDTTCNAACKTKGQGKVAILKQGRKKFLLTTQNLLES